MQSWNISEVTNLLLEAGHTALSYFDATSPSLKSDRSIVTEADTYIEAELAKHFDDPERGVYMIGEETNDQRGEDYVQRALHGTTWVVDPIDGTSPYAFHLPSWGVSIGLMRDSRLQEGAIFLPASGEMAVTDGDTLLYGELGCNPEEWDASVLAPFRYTALGNPGGGIVSLAQGVLKRGRFTGDYTIHAVGSCVYSVIAMLRGAFVGYVASVKLWDIAAAIPMLHKLGFVMKFGDGTRYDGSVDERSFLLSPNAERRWYMRGHLYIAVDEATCDDLIEHTHFSHA